MAVEVESTKARRMEKERVPWWLWPNLLSLDAPLVALVWAWMFAKAWGVVSVPWQLWVTLSLAVWIVYVLDRLLDARLGDGREPRHHFHSRFSRVFLVLVVLATGWCVHSVLFVLAKTVFQYGLVILIMAAAYFGAVWSQKRDGRPMVGKNVLAGLTFAYGTAAGIHAYSPVVGIAEMFLSAEVIIFAGLCVVNMTAIDFWNLEGEDEEDAAAVLNLGTLLLGGLAMFVYFSALKRDFFFFYEGFYHERLFYKPFAAGVLVGAACFFLLNQARRRIKKSAYRVLVDLAVVSPVFVFWVMTALNQDSVR